MIFGARMEHDLTAPTADAAVVKINQTATFLTNGLRQISCQNHRQQHNHQKQQQHQQNPQQHQNESNTNADAFKTNEKDENTGINSNVNANDSGQVDTIHFKTETLRFRLLRGVIYANEVRQFNLNKDGDYLVCRRFWEDNLAVTTAVVDNKFNYREQFAVFNDDAFLWRVYRQYLQLELWRRQLAINSDGNRNRNKNGATKTNDLKPLDIVRLPLHQFFIAYRNVAITNHLGKGKLPVISFDAWAPITSFTESRSQPIGELRCMLAIGSDEQIANLMVAHGYCDDSSTGVEEALFVQCPTETGTMELQVKPQTTTKRLGFLHRSLDVPAATSALMPPVARKTKAVKTTTFLPPILKPLEIPYEKSFLFLLEIQRAFYLPCKALARRKKSSKRSNASKQQRFPTSECPPSTNVTFQADEGSGPSVYATKIFEKSTQPKWQQRFGTSVSVDYLYNPQNRFILKIWEKTAIGSALDLQQPSPLEDALLGFAALDLGVFLRGPYLAGCFNIFDFNGRINGHLEVQSYPLQDVQKLVPASPIGNPKSMHYRNTSFDNFLDEFDNIIGLTHLNLSQAMERKFTELENISQRLRTRLCDITDEELAMESNASLLYGWQADGTDNNANAEFDEFDQFEHDINTVPTSPYTARNNDAIGDGQHDINQFKISFNASETFGLELKSETKSMIPQ